jgi:predicted transcriptional regulator
VIRRAKKPLTAMEIAQRVEKTFEQKNVSAAISVTLRRLKAKGLVLTKKNKHLAA